MGERRPFAFLLAAGYTVALVLTMGLALALTQAIRPASDRDLVTIAGCYTLAHFAVLFVAIRVHEPESSLRSVMGLRKVSVIPALAAVALGAGSYPALARVDDFFSSRFPTDDKSEEVLNALMATPTIGARVVLVLVFCVALPASGEVFFRGFVYGSLRRGRDAGLAAAATTAFFVLSRFDFRAMGSLLALGAALAFVRTRTGSALASFLTHAAFYAIPLRPLARGGRVTDDGAYTLQEVSAGLVVAVLALLALQLTSTRSGRSVAALAMDEA